MNNVISSEEWSIINEIITSIYSAIPYPDLNAVVNKLNRLILFSGSVSCLISDGDGKVEFFQYKSDTIPEAHIKAYCEKYVFYDFILWYCAVPKALVFRQSDIIVEKYLVESKFMKEWLDPINAYYGATMNIAGNGHSLGNICLYRSRDEGDFSDKDLLIMGIINDHLCTCYEKLFPNGIIRSTISKTSDTLSAKYHLTQREAATIHAVCSGTRRHNLAAELFISENTVKKHLNSIYKKMNISNFEELIKKVNPATHIIG